MGSSLLVSDSDSLSVGCSGLVVSDSVGVVGSSVSEGSSEGFSDSEDSGFEVEVPGVTLNIVDTNVYHGCLVLDINNIDDYTFA